MDSDRKDNIEYDLRLYTSLLFLVEVPGGYVRSDNVETESRQPNAKTLPTRADDEEDISKH